jgi:hypothetical protein
MRAEFRFAVGAHRVKGRRRRGPGLLAPTERNQGFRWWWRDPALGSARLVGPWDCDLALDWLSSVLR